ncbi:MAG TPA: endonuclease/exonuclease/phosphatase family protein [Burkholderiales bacterium]
MLEAALWAVGALVVLATLLPFIRRGWWWVRVCDFPRLQLFVLGLAVLAALLVLGPGSAADWLGIAVLTVTVLYQGYRILPYTPLWSVRALPSRNPDPDRRLRLLIANVQVGNRSTEPLLNLVHATDPDVLLALETDGFWVDMLACLDARFAWRIKLPRDNAYGMLLLSKLELRDAKVRYLMEENVPSIVARMALRCGDEIDFYALHPRPPHAFQASTDRDAEILVVGREIRERSEPAIVAGDLNDVAWSHITRLFRRLSDMLDPRIGRGLYATFNARRPLLRWPLDHIFFTEDFRVVGLERMGFIGSDHFPILVELSYEPGLADEQEARVMAPDDRAMVRRKIRRARASS